MGGVAVARMAAAAGEAAFGAGVGVAVVVLGRNTIAVSSPMMVVMMLFVPARAWRVLTQTPVMSNSMTTRKRAALLWHWKAIPGYLLLFNRMYNLLVGGNVLQQGHSHLKGRSDHRLLLHCLKG
mmetsp:Transcript_19092/g.41159  ORF Transcript_19092/g.41159 Transcript_19092/m.41159 type:complete len:124 (+) Transcript_19092:474-845(+)